MSDSTQSQAFRRPLVSSVVLALLVAGGALATACGSSVSNGGDGNGSPDGGTAGTAGTASGGSSGTNAGSAGDAGSDGGEPGSGGAPSSGGTSSDGGTPSEGGATASGGTGNSGTGAQAGTNNGGSAGREPPVERPDDVDFIEDVTVDTLAGSSEAGDADGDSATARFSNPVSITRIDDETFAVADYDSSLVRLLDVAGNVSTIAQPEGFDQPYGLAFVNGTVFVQTDRNTSYDKDSQTGTLWTLPVETGVIAPLAENLGRPRSFAAVNDTTLAIADYLHHVISLMDVASGELTVIAGSLDQPGFADGSGSDARFDMPAGIVMRSDGSFVVADGGNRRIRLVTPEGEVSTLAGEGSSGSVDGPGDEASFVRPRALAIDADDNVYVSDDGAHRIRRVEPDGDVLTVAGAGSDENDYQDGDGSEARFAGQEGLALSADGKILYVADGNGGVEVEDQLGYHRIRRVYLP